MREINLRACLIAVSLVFWNGSVKAYEIHFGGETGTLCSVCWTAPASRRIQTVLLDREIFFLERDGNRAETFSPQYGSVSCVTSNDVTDVVISGGDRRGNYRFRRGVLESVSGSEPVGSKRARDVERRLLRPETNGFLWSSFWHLPPRDDGRGFWENDQRRWKLWFENPNEAGALLALVAVLVFSGFWAFGGFWRIHCLFWTLFALLALVQTGSRGGMMAFLTGALAMALCNLARRFTLRKLVCFCLVVACLAGAAFLVLGHTRIIGHLVEVDAGNRIRLDVWSAVPRMMICAPFGWRMPTGYAYCDWFQPLSFAKPLRYLISSHLSIMVWGGYAVAFAYAFLWIAILHSTLIAGCRGRLTAFGLWIALGVAMMFSPVGLYHWELWLLPSVALLVHIVRSFREHRPSLARIRWDALAAAALIVVLAAVGWICESRADNPFLIRRVSGGVQIGQGGPETCIVDDGTVLSAGFIGEVGKDLRAHAVAHPKMGTVLMVNSLETVPDPVSRLVLTGSRCTEYVRRMREGLPCPAAQEVYLVSPQNLRSAMMAGAKSRGRVKVIAGALIFDLTGKSGNLPAWFTAVPGAAVYIPDWPRYIGL